MEGVEKTDGVEGAEIIVGTEGIEKTAGAVREIMLRADIDALPQTELYESPWKSRNEGVMHACGHDFHTTALAGAALLLQRAKTDGRLCADVDLVFQPAEEGTTGARMMIDAGLFDLIHPDLCFGLHNWPSVPSGRHHAALCGGALYGIRHGRRTVLKTGSQD